MLESTIRMSKPTGEKKTKKGTGSQQMFDVTKNCLQTENQCKIHIKEYTIMMYLTNQIPSFNNNK